MLSDMYDKSYSVFFKVAGLLQMSFGSFTDIDFNTEQARGDFKKIENFVDLF